MTSEVVIGDTLRRVELQRDPSATGGFLARVDGREFRFSAVKAGRNVLSIIMDGRSYQVLREAQGAEGDTNIVISGVRYPVEVRDPRALLARRARSRHGDGPRKLLSPMPGRVVRVLAEVGAQLAAGTGIIVIEAMKMQNELKSPKDGVLAKVAVTPGMAVNAGDVLAVVE
ncbi:MAG: acetyl-CoA carboxylase biotin carboxyl carrier protein subunit [Acidobacteria bacterium]|nr:acetyl-CoA carboxylase biotin carboxyl carrier protein subunit [Acidobacteriota bacterium]